MKTKRGRKAGSGVFSGIKPEWETWQDIRNRIIYGSVEWRIIRLCQLMRDGSKLPTNYLSSRKAQWESKWPRKPAPPKKPKPTKLRFNAKRRYVLLDEIDVLWRDVSAEFERAVLDGDANWFKRQSKAIEKGGMPQRVRFNTRVLDLLESAMWGTHARAGEKCDDLTLTPAGKFTDAMASHIYEALHKQERDGLLIVEGWQFESKGRVMEAIHDIAKRLQFALKKQARER